MTDQRAPVAIAVDLGGTKLSAAAVDADGRMLYRDKIFVSRANVTTCAAEIAQLVQRITGELALSPQAIAGIGVIIPGIYSAETGMGWAPNLWGHDEVPLRAELERVLNARIAIDSDRVGYVMGESWLGAARGLNDVVFLSVGTGIGAGILSGGHILRGAAGIAGAVGWFSLTPEWEEIYRQVGCWEAECAGPALARRGHKGTAEEVVAEARRCDAEALRAIHRAGEYLGSGVANIVSILNPRMIVLGGGLMQAGDLFLESVKQGVARWAQPVAARQVDIELTRLGEDAGLFGAARLVLSGS